MGMKVTPAFSASCRASTIISLSRLIWSAYSSDSQMLTWTMEPSGAAAAGTTVPAVRRRFRSKASVAVAVIDSLRVESMPAEPGPPRSRALAVLRNFRANLLRPNSMAVAGTLLAEEHRQPELLAAFRHRLVEPRRAALRQALADGIRSGELPDSADPDILASMLIGSFYARYIATSDIPDDWAEQTLRHVWPDARSARPRVQARPG